MAYQEEYTDPALLADANIGEKGRFEISEKEQVAQTSLHMVKQARRTIDIVCRDLEPRLYDNDEFANAIKAFATNSRMAKVRMLIHNSDHIIKNGHRLLELTRRLTSYMEIRVQGKGYREFNEAWLIIDETAWLRRPHSDRFEGECDFYAPRQLRDVLKSFDSMWNEAVLDPNLRQLHI